jgi:hypothetical protein
METRFAMFESLEKGFTPRLSVAFIIKEIQNAYTTYRTRTGSGQTSPLGSVYHRVNEILRHQQGGTTLSNIELWKQFKTNIDCSEMKGTTCWIQTPHSMTKYNSAIWYQTAVYSICMETTLHFQMCWFSEP